MWLAFFMGCGKWNLNNLLTLCDVWALQCNMGPTRTPMIWVGRGNNTPKSKSYIGWVIVIVLHGAKSHIGFLVDEIEFYK